MKNSNSVSYHERPLTLQQQGKSPKEKKKFLNKIALVATFGGLLFGYDTGVINGSLMYMSRPDQLNLDYITEGMVTSSLLFGSAFGSIIGGRISDRYGRRRYIVCLALIFFFSVLGCALSSNSDMLIAFRFILGLAVGGAAVAVPTYLAEIAPAENRGQFVTRNELMIVTGQFLSFLVNAILGNLFGEAGYIWRYMLAVASIPAIVLGFGMIVMPESPRWLVKNGRPDEALKVLKRVRDENQAIEELKAIKHILSEEASMKKASLTNILKTPWLRRILFIGIAVGFAQQCTGVNAINYYGTQILTNAGFEMEAALIANTANGLISVTATFIGILLLGKYKRRTIITVGLLMTSIAQIYLCGTTLFLSGTEVFPYLALFGTCFFMAFQQGGGACVTWLVMSEIMPLRFRGAGMGTIVFFTQMANFSVGMFFPIALSTIGMAYTFLCFAFLGLFILAVLRKWMPETKGRTLEELEDDFRNYKTNKPKTSLVNNTLVEYEE